MACIEHYIRDAENIFDEIKARQKDAQDNALLEYRAARCIQRWFRGYITRKYIKHLNACAITIQKYWRGYVDRQHYYELLKETVHKMHWEYYNSMATKIQKVWRGHYVRRHIFSYYKLKEYIDSILAKNKEFLECAKMYENYTEMKMQRQREKECQEWLKYLSFRVHHLIRTYQIEGIYSIHGSHKYSPIEEQLKEIKFTDYMNIKHEKSKEKLVHKPQENYIFEGRLRECEKVWLHRNDPGKYSLATGEYGAETRQYMEQQKTQEKLLRLQDKEMLFGPFRYKDVDSMLDVKSYECPPLHRTVKNAQH